MAVIGPDIPPGEKELPGPGAPPPPPPPVLEYGITVTRYVALNGKHAAKVVQKNPDPAQTYVCRTDMIGSVRAITDSAGMAATRFEYEPFGLLTMSTGPMAAGAHRFTGKPEDEAAELYHFGARYYDPVIGRFTSRDPAKDGLNWYSYCRQNPLAYVDPDGKYPWDAKRLLNQYRSDIIRISKTYGIPPAALATVVYGENVRRSCICELKDEAAILGLIMEGHDASIGICQVKFSTALMLDCGGALNAEGKAMPTESSPSRDNIRHGIVGLCSLGSGAAWV